MAPKQLHYILVNLEAIGLIRRQVVSSERKRSLVHLARFAVKHKSLVDALADHLMEVGADHGSESGHQACCDDFAAVRRALGLTQKRFKALLALAEKNAVIERYTGEGNQDTATTSKEAAARQVRMLRLTEKYFRSQTSGPSRNDDETSDDEEAEIAVHESLGVRQSHKLPVYTQMFACVEGYARDGISLKQIGTMFALDFYKSRRMGNNLQTHPDIVTILKETNKGKSKFQTIVLRRFLKESATAVAPSPGSPAHDDMLILRRESQPNQSIQALQSQRMLARKGLILHYLSEHRICTKYDLTREIRQSEQQQGLTGTIDAKTTRRMLLALEREKKLITFEVHLVIVLICPAMSKITVKLTPSSHIGFDREKCEEKFLQKTRFTFSKKK